MMILSKGITVEKRKRTMQQGKKMKDRIVMLNKKKEREVKAAVMSKCIVFVRLLSLFLLKRKTLSVNMQCKTLLG
jgi:hypothetical protein